MADMILSPGGWSPLPDSSFRLECRNPDSLFLYLASKANAKNRYRWVTQQSVLAKMFKVSVRTIRRWIATLRSQGRLCVDYLYTSDRRRYTSVFSLPLFRERSKTAGGSHRTPSVLTGSKPKTKSKNLPFGQVLHPGDVNPSVAPAPCDPPPSGGVPPAPSSGAAFDVSPAFEDRSDKEGNVHTVAVTDEIVDNLKRNAVSRIREFRGVGDPATRRVLAWWLTYRRVPTSDEQIYEMAWFVKRCLSRGSTELQLEEKLFELMARGLDVGKVLERSLGWFAHVGGKHRATFKYRERSRTSWSHAEQPGLYRETRVLPKQSPCWLPLGPSTAKLADARQFEAGLGVAPGPEVSAERVAEAMSWTMADWAAGIVVSV